MALVAVERSLASSGGRVFALLTNDESPVAGGSGTVCVDGAVEEDVVDFCCDGGCCDCFCCDCCC